MVDINAGSTIATNTPNGLTKVGAVYTDTDPSTTFAGGTGTTTADSIILNLNEIDINSRTATVELDECIVTIRSLLTGVTQGASESLFRRGTWTMNGGSLIISRDSADGTLGGNTFRTLSGEGTFTNNLDLMRLNLLNVYINGDDDTQVLLNFRAHIADLTGSTIGNRVVSYFPAGTAFVGTTFAGTATEPSLARPNGGNTANIRLTSPLVGTNQNFTPFFGITALGWLGAGAFESNIQQNNDIWLVNCNLPPTLNIGTRSTNTATQNIEVIQAWRPRFVNTANGQPIAEQVQIQFPTGTNYYLMPTVFGEASLRPGLQANRFVDFTNSAAATSTAYGFRQGSIATTTANNRSSSAGNALAHPTTITNTTFELDTWEYRTYDNTGSRISYATATTPVNTSTIYRYTAFSDNGVTEEVYNTTEVPRTTVMDIVASGSTTKVATTDQIYAASKQIGLTNFRAEIPWQVDQMATFNSTATPPSGRQNRTVAPGSASTYLLHENITSITFTNGDGYSESLTYNSEGNITAGTITIGIDNLVLGGSGRAIRIDRGRTATLQNRSNDNIGLDTAIIDDFEPIPAALGNSSIVYPTSSIDPGIAWRIVVGTSEIASGEGPSANDTVVDFNTHSTILTSPVIIEYNNAASLTNIRRTLALARVVGQDVSVTVPLDALQEQPRVPTSAQSGFTITIESTALTNNTVDIDAVGLSTGATGSLNIAGATAVGANARATVVYLRALDLLIRGRNLVDLTMEGTNSVDYIIATEQGLEFIDEYVNMDDNGTTNSTTIPGAVWVNTDRTSRGQEADLLPTNVMLVSGIPQVVGGVRFAQRTVTVNNEQTIVDAINTRGRRTALGIP